MLDFGSLTKNRSPYVHLVKGDYCKLEEGIGEALRGSQPHLLLKMRGQSMSTFDGLYDEFSRALSFPDYFGGNYNALSECLSDLSWLEYSLITIAIRQAEKVLVSESKDAITGLAEILIRVGEEWSVPIKEGEVWDREAIPFHVIFHTENSEMLSELARIKGVQEH